MMARIAPAVLALLLAATSTDAQPVVEDSLRAATSAGTQPAPVDSVRSAVAAGEQAVAPDSIFPPLADYERFFDRFLAQKTDSLHVADIAHVSFERDGGRFTLEEGVLRLFTPIEGRVCGLVFSGKGHFALTPPTAIERDQLRRFYGTTSLDRAFHTLVLVFADSTREQLTRGLAWHSTRGVTALSVALQESFKYMSDDKEKWLDAGVARPFLEGRRSDYFFAQIDGTGERLFFEVDPHVVEAVTLYHEPHARHVGLKRVFRRDEICRFTRPGADTVADRDVHLAVDVNGYRLDCRIGENLDFSATADLRCRAAEDRVGWMRLTLAEELIVDSVAWSDGRKARFFKGKDSPQLWISADRPLARGDSATLRVAYHGRLIQRIGDWMFVESSIGWYPQPEGWPRAPIDVTFHAPSQYLLASVGERVRSETQGRVTVTHWSSERPIRNATFVMGVFEERPIQDAGAPPSSVLMMTGMRDSISWVNIGERSFRMGGKMDKGVAEDAGHALDFFQRQFGPPSPPRIRVVEIPALGGEAFPGIVRLTWTPFMGPNAGAEDAVFRAHELAHQWWGVDVDFATYRDQWLSEGFAQYSALWYMQAGRKDNRSYFAVLDQWQDEILAQGRQRPSGAAPLGPIWLGGRAATVEAPNDYQLAVYKKGAWVLHMLRNMLLDIKTMDDERFANLMRDFYARYAGKSASTEDFRRVAQRYAGEDLGWFFDQWVYRSEIPTYRFASRTERTPEGKYKVTCRVEQRDVAPGFRMPVPVRVDFEDGRFTWLRILVQSPSAEFELPLMELAPKAIVFNDLESVLCRVEPVKW
jgi:peptidase M1-like protein